MDLNFERLGTALVMLCECPRKTEGDHMHQRPDGSGETRTIDGPPGTEIKLQVPVTEPVLVKGGVPRIVLRPDGDDQAVQHIAGLDSPSMPAVQRRYAGACRRCGEVFSCTLTVTELGLREPAPEAKEAADGTGHGDQSG